MWLNKLPNIYHQPAVWAKNRKKKKKAKQNTILWGFSHPLSHPIPCPKKTLAENNRRALGLCWYWQQKHIQLFSLDKRTFFKSFKASYTKAIMSLPHFNLCSQKPLKEGRSEPIFGKSCWHQYKENLKPSRHLFWLNLLVHSVFFKC